MLAAGVTPLIACIATGVVIAHQAPAGDENGYGVSPSPARAYLPGR